MRGAALLLVLWLLVLLAGLVSVFALTARTEGLQGRYLVRSLQARYSAEAGIEVAVQRLRSGEEALRWLPDGRSNAFVFSGQAIQVQLMDELAKVDINTSTPDLLSNLMVALAVEPTKARQLTGAILDWRDGDDLLNGEGGAEDPEYKQARLPYGAKDRPFETISELRLVLGMEPAIYSKIAPYLTIYTGQSRPNAVFAAEPVLRAMGVSEQQIAQLLAQRADWLPGKPLPVDPTSGALAVIGQGTYSISSLATRADGTHVRINAIVRLSDGSGLGQLYMPLAWRVGESD